MNKLINPLSADKVNQYLNGGANGINKTTRVVAFPKFYQTNLDIIV